MVPWIKQPVFIALPIVIDWRNDEELKKRFAIALQNKQFKTPFEAACSIFGNETNKALYAAASWINDPIVIEAKEQYNETQNSPVKLLDKQEFATRLLVFSEEKINYNGNLVYAAEAKDRLAALKIYGETMGYLNNKTTEIINNNSIQDNRFIEIKFVEPEKKENIKVIDNTPEEAKEENILEDLDLDIKLVG